MFRPSRTPADTPRRNLNLLWFAQSTSLVGLQTGSVAIPLLAVDVLGASASQVAVIGTLSSLPWLIAPIIGPIVDRANRHRLLVIAHLGRSLLWLTLPLAYLLGVLTLPQLWIVCAAVGLLGVVFAVGYRTFLPTIVARENLGAANGRMGGTDAVARAAGPAFAGSLVQVAGAAWTILVQTTTAVLAAVATARIRPAPRSLQADRAQQRFRPADWWRSIVDGFRHVYRIRALRWIALGDTAYLFCFDLCFAVVVVFFRSTLGLSPGMIGLIFSIGSLGGILGAMLANRIRARHGFDRTVRTAAVLRGFGLLMLPASLLAPNPATGIAMLIMARGINASAWSVYEVLTDTYQQTVLPDAHRGSAIAAILWLGNVASTVAAATAAALAAATNTSTVVAAAGIGAAVASLISLRISTTPQR